MIRRSSAPVRERGLDLAALATSRWPAEDGTDRLRRGAAVASPSSSQSRPPPKPPARGAAGARRVSGRRPARARRADRSGALPGVRRAAADRHVVPQRHTVFDDTRQAVPLISRRPASAPRRLALAGGPPEDDLRRARGPRLPHRRLRGRSPPCVRRAGVRARRRAIPTPSRTLASRAGGRSAAALRIERIGRGRRPALYVKHTLLPHVPYMLPALGPPHPQRRARPDPRHEQRAGLRRLFPHPPQRAAVPAAAGFVDRQLGR